MAQLMLTGHFLKDGLYLAHASRASYFPSPQTYAPYRSLGLGAPRVFTSANSRFDDFGFVASDDQNVIVAIRGTDDIWDWRSNINFVQTSALGGDVHTGFWNSTVQLLPQVLQALSDEGIAGKKLRITGHSRGGALAVLLAQKLFVDNNGSNRDLTPNSVYTFGAPRVGDISFYHKYDLRAKTHLFVNEGDPVPDIPPAQADYVHVDRQHLLLRNSVRNVDIDEFSLRLIALRFPPQTSDHSLVNGYIANIESNLG